MVHSTSSPLGWTPNSLAGWAPGTLSTLATQRRLCSFQFAFWQGLLQYETKPQREHLKSFSWCRQQFSQVLDSSLEEGFFFGGITFQRAVFECEKNCSQFGVKHSAAEAFRKTPCDNVGEGSKVKLTFFFGISAENNSNGSLQKQIQG